MRTAGSVSGRVGPGSIKPRIVGQSSIRAYKGPRIAQAYRGKPHQAAIANDDIFNKFEIADWGISRWTVTFVWNVKYIRYNKILP